MGKMKMLSDRVSSQAIPETAVDLPTITTSDKAVNENFFAAPNFPDEAIKTDKTDKTDSIDLSAITNDAFIVGIFGEIGGIERPVVVSFSGNPATTKPSNWYGKHYIAGKFETVIDHNNYLSFASFRPDDAGKYRRQKKQFASLSAVLLDDIGVKVPVGKIALKPSWMIETSEGNFQIGFILDAPITDASQADQLLNAIIDAGLTDPGASGPCSRIGRLPLGINGKYQNSDGSPWQCRLVEWHPQLRYSMNELLNGLGIELKDPALKQPSSAKHPPASHRLAFQSLDDVHIPRADEHPVITALKNSGRYKQPLGAGKHDITCPWVDEHTAQIDQGTAYWQPSENYPLGGFKCLHGHCANRRVSELYEFLGIDKVSAKHKPIILVQPGELPRICNAAEIERYSQIWCIGNFD
jgi:hypothetical protein